MAAHVLAKGQTNADKRASVRVEGLKFGGEAMKYAARMIALCSWLVCAACGPPWVVVTATDPNPLPAEREFVVDEVRYEKVLVGDASESGWLRKQDEKQRAAWDTGKQTLSQRYAESLASHLPELKFAKPNETDAFVVRSRVTFIEPGFYTATAARPTQVNMTVEIANRAGRAVDVIEIRATAPATMSNPTIAERLASAAEVLGERTAEYLRSRVFP